MEITKQQKNSRVLGYITGSLLTLCVLIIFWPPADPSSRYKSVTTWHVTRDQMVSADKVVAEFNQLIAQVSEFSDRGELTPERMFALQKRLKYLVTHLEQYGPDSLSGGVVMSGGLLMRLTAARDGSRQFRQYSKEESARFRSFFTTDPEYLAIEKFRASDTISNWPVVVAHYIQRFLMSIPVGVLACIFLMMRGGRKFIHALAVAFGNPIKMAVYPAGILWILLGNQRWADYHAGMRRIVNWLSYATAASVSIFFGGVASAQTVKKDEKKKNSAYMLQLDSRIVAPIGGVPPLLFNRSTFNAKSWLVESISTATPETKSWYNEIGIGAKVVRTSQTTVNLVAIKSTDSSDIHKVMVGAQYFRSGPLAIIAVPVIRFEKTLDGPLAFTVAPNPIFRLGRKGVRNRLALSPDGVIRKTFGKALTWTAGLGFDVFPRKGKGDRIEAAVLRTSVGQWQLRARYVVNFAF